MKKKIKKLALIIGVISLSVFAGCGDKVNDDLIQDGKESVKENSLESSSSENESEQVSDEETMLEETEIEEGSKDSSETQEVEGEVNENAEPDTSVLETHMSETIPPETEVVTENVTEQISEPGIVASLLREHYAGDVLTARDFNIQVTNEDGTKLVNPRGWVAAPLELSEGENNITVAYGNFTTVININAGKRPEGMNVESNVPSVVAPVVSVNPDAFSVSGPAVLVETPDMGQEYLDKIIFLGDSRTYSYKAYGVLSGGKNTTQVWTPRSGTMTLAAQGYAMIVYPETGADVSIRDAVAAKKPEYMVIGLGTNGISFMSKEYFKSEYTALINDIKSISPDTKIMINSIYPVANYYARLDLINNEKVAECNRWLVEIAEETGAKYLNTAEALVDEAGWLNIGYDNGGGATHLNRQGNDIVMRYIRTHGYQ